MNEPVMQSLCDERYSAVQRSLFDLKKDINELFRRLNWFYVTVIGVLLVQLFASTYQPKQPDIKIIIDKAALTQ